MRIVRQGFTFNSSSMFEEVTEDTGWLSLGSVKVEDGSDFTDEEGLEGAGGVVPPETLPVPVPELQAVLLLSVLISRNSQSNKNFVRHGDLTGSCWAPQRSSSRR